MLFIRCDIWLFRLETRRYLRKFITAIKPLKFYQYWNPKKEPKTGFRSKEEKSRTRSNCTQKRTERKQKSFCKVLPKKKKKKRKGKKTVCVLKRFLNVFELKTGYILPTCCLVRIETSMYHFGNK